MGNKGWSADSPGRTKAHKLGLMQSAHRTDCHRNRTSARRQTCTHGTHLYGAWEAGKELGTVFLPQYSPAMSTRYRRPAIVLPH